MLEILSDPQRTGLGIVTTPEEMPVNETIELSKSVREQTTVDLAAVVVNRVLPELSDAERSRSSTPSAALSQKPLSSGWWVRPHPGPGGGQARCAAASTAQSIWTGFGRRSIRRFRCSCCRCSCPRIWDADDPPDRRVTLGGVGFLMARPDRQRSEPTQSASGSLDGLLAFVREIVVACGPGEWARRPLQPPQRRWPLGVTAKGPRAHRRSRKKACEAARSRRNREQRATLSRRGLLWRRSPRGQLWAAMLDTKESWDALIRRHAPDERNPRRDPPQPPLRPDPRGSSRATTTSRWSACTRYTRAATTT